MTPTASDLYHARLLWDYLQLGVPTRPAECLLVLGGHDIGVATRTADLYEQKIAPLVVVTGGSRAVPDGSDSVPREAIALERLAANTSENFWLAAELLRDLGLDPATFLAVTKPYAERRAIATARRRWPHKTVAVTSQQATFDEYLIAGIPADRILSHLAGEALRLEAYAAAGLIDPGEPVPENILDAARTLQAAGFSSRAITRCA